VSLIGGRLPTCGFLSSWPRLTASRATSSTMVVPRRLYLIYIVLKYPNTHPHPNPPLPFRSPHGPGPSASATNTPSASRQRQDRVPATPAWSAAVSAGPFRGSSVLIPTHTRVGRTSVTRGAETPSRPQLQRHAREGQKKFDTDRTRTCAADANRFLVDLLNQDRVDR